MHLARAAFALSFALCTLPARADELPPRKAGLWELTITHEGVSVPPQRWQQCIDEETDRRMRFQWLSADEALCEVQSIRRSGEAIIVEKACGAPQSGTTLRGVIIGDFNSAYAVRVTLSRFIGAGSSVMIESGPTGMTYRDGPFTIEHHRSIAAKFLGACKVWMWAGRTYLWNGSDFVTQW